MTTPSSSPTKPIPSSSSVPTVPLPDFVHCEENCIICSETIFEGPHPIQIGKNTIIHPRVTIAAKNGAILIGSDNIIEENVIIETTTSEPILIGDFNLIRVASQINCCIGSGNIIEVRAKLLSTAKITDGCVVSQTITVNDKLTDNNMVLYKSHIDGMVERKCLPSQKKDNMDEIKTKQILKEILEATHKLYK